MYRMYVFCFSYPLLLNKPPQSLVAWSNNQHLFCLCICNLGRTQWNQLTSAPCSVCWGNSTEYGKGGLEDLLSRWCTCMTGKLVPPACQPGIQPGLWARAFGSPSRLLGLPHVMMSRNWGKPPAELEAVFSLWPGPGSYRASLLGVGKGALAYNEGTEALPPGGVLSQSRHRSLCGMRDVVVAVF